MPQIDLDQLIAATAIAQGLILATVYISRLNGTPDSDASEALAQRAHKSWHWVCFRLESDS